MQVLTTTGTRIINFTSREAIDDDKTYSIVITSEEQNKVIYTDATATFTDAVGIDTGEILILTGGAGFTDGIVTITDGVTTVTAEFDDKPDVKQFGPIDEIAPDAGIFEIDISDQDGLDLRISDWILELAEYFYQLYGREQGDFVTKMVVSKCITNGHTIH